MFDQIVQFKYNFAAAHDGGQVVGAQSIFDQGLHLSGLRIVTIKLIGTGEKAVGMATIESMPARILSRYLVWPAHS
ncbi:MAG: hypothetical protein M3N54_00420, partial [Acidobacteriota bacterium]|nr:hypothetical protein [Acidobacteriota bacterium]